MTSYLILTACVGITWLGCENTIRKYLRQLNSFDVPLPTFGFVTASGLDIEPTHDECVWIPGSFLKRLIPEETIYEISHLEQERMRALAADLVDNGTEEPLIIVMDNNGVCLRDGHHRVLTGSQEHFPVELQQSDRIRKYKRPLGDLVDLLWERSKGSRV